jgi:hypothetical protein
VPVNAGNSISADAPVIADSVPPLSSDPHSAHGIGDLAPGEDHSGV